MLAASIPLAQYRNEKLVIFGSIAFLLALSMLGVTIIFQRGTQNIVIRLANIIETMKSVRAGNRGARSVEDRQPDEITILSMQFIELLDTLKTREDAEACAQQ